MQLLLVADDLTGALDSAVAFAEAGLSCRVARRPGDIAVAMAADCDVLAVSTASREASEAAAREAVAEVFDAFAAGPPRLVFKKIDSRLKGHVAAETGVAAARAGLGRALVAPAIPAQGRYTVHGRLEGTGVALPIDIAAQFAGSDLALEVPDARTAADLNIALDAALTGGKVLLVGAAGLAAALARRLGPGRGARMLALPAPLLLAVGSRDPITLAQVEAVRAAGLVDMLPAPDGEIDGTPPAHGDRPLLVLMTAGGGQLDVRTAAARFARSAANVVAPLSPATLFCCGGETTDAILAALGVGVLDLEGELLPGIPVSRMVVHGRTMRLVTKSGGFGLPDTLSSVVQSAIRQLGDAAR